jgi:hypothetical protein
MVKKAGQVTEQDEWELVPDKIKIMLYVDGKKYGIWAPLEDVNEDVLNILSKRLLDKINEHRKTLTE